MLYICSRDNKRYLFDFFTDDEGAHVILYPMVSNTGMEKGSAHMSIKELSDRWGDGFDVESISEDEWDKVRDELIDKAVKRI